MTTTERESWLAERRTGIGSSDAAAVLGLSPWATALDVYISKVMGHSLPMSDAMEWGHRLEPAIAGAAIDRHGWSLRKCELMRHAEYPFLCATPDRMNAEGELIEIKTTSRDEGWGEPETDEIPPHYWLQTQHQLAVAHSIEPVDLCWVCVLVAGRDYRRYRVPRDPEYLDTVLSPLREFWGCVETRTPPEPDWSHPATVEAVSKLYRPAEGTTVGLDGEAALLADEYQRLGSDKSEIEARREEIKARLIVALGNAETGELPDGRQVRRKITPRAGYSVLPSQSIDFRILKGKKNGR